MSLNLSISEVQLGNNKVMDADMALKKLKHPLIKKKKFLHN